jgi:hypothetical protein
MPDGSPLYIDGEKRDDPPVVDRTSKNLIIQGNWYDIASHIKWALIAKGLKFFSKTVTDEKLKNVWLGNEKYNSRPKKNRDDDSTYNSLSDLIGENYHLLIIRLGHLGYKNIAMPGILKEALMLRQVARVPTWLIVEPGNPFVPGHFAYSDDVYSYLAHNKYEIIRIKETEAGRRAALAESLSEQADEEGNLSMGVDNTPTVQSPPPAKPRSDPPPSVTGSSMDMAGLDDAKGKWRPNKKKRWGSGSGGEGGI